MSTFILQNLDTGKYAAKPGRLHSYTGDPLEAQRFRSREEAKRNACGNEKVVDFWALLRSKNA